VITVLFNGSKKEIDSDTNLMDFLQEEQQNFAYMAIAINRQFIPRSQYHSILIKQGDEIECVTPMQGG